MEAACHHQRDERSLIETWIEFKRQAARDRHAPTDGLHLCILSKFWILTGCSSQQEMQVSSKCVISFSALVPNTTPTVDSSP